MESTARPVESLPTHRSGKFRKSQRTIRAAREAVNGPETSPAATKPVDIDLGRLVEMHNSLLQLVMAGYYAEGRSPKAASAPPSPPTEPEHQYEHEPNSPLDHVVVPFEKEPEAPFHPPTNPPCVGPSPEAPTPNGPSALEMPLCEIPEPESDRSRIVAIHGSKRILFACPHCSHRLVVKLKHHGTICTCDDCGGYFRAPILKRHSETIHNEAFPFPADTGKALMRKQLGLRKRQRHDRYRNWLLAPGIAAMLLALPIVLTSLGSPSPPSTGLQTHQDPDYARQATELVKAYLAADGWEAKSAFVRDPLRVRPMMKDYYENRGHDAGPKQYTFMHYSEVQLGLPVLTSQITLEIDHQPVRGFAIEHHPSGPVIEWESHVIYNAMPWQEFRDIRPLEPHVFRIAAREGSYYNYRFSDPERYLCLQLTLPSDFGQPIYAYTERNSPIGARLLDLINEKGSLQWQPLILDLQFGSEEDGFGRNQLTIRDLVWKNWRLPEEGVVGGNLEF